MTGSVLNMKVLPYISIIKNVWEEGVRCFNKLLLDLIIMREIIGAINSFLAFPVKICREFLNTG
jgi:hypothetical protein